MSATKIAYIAGYGRSGSTLLSLLLNRQKGFVNIGESVKLFRYEEGVSKSKLWKQVQQDSLKQTGLTNEPGQKYASYFWYFLKFKKGLHLFKTIWPTIFLDLEKKIGAEVFVDASKSTRGAFTRPVYMQKSGMDVKVIHIIRSPYGVMDSFEKGRNNSNSEKLVKGKKGGALRALMSWFFINSLVSLVYRRHFSKKEILVVNYDFFTKNFEQEIKRIYSFLNVEFDESLLENEITLEPDLSFSGNRLRLKETISIKPSVITKRRGALGYLTQLLLFIYNLIEPHYETD